MNTDSRGDCKPPGLQQIVINYHYRQPPQLPIRCLQLSPLQNKPDGLREPEKCALQRSRGDNCINLALLGAGVFCGGGFVAAIDCPQSAGSGANRREKTASVC